MSISYLFITLQLFPLPWPCPKASVRKRSPMPFCADSCCNIFRGSTPGESTKIRGTKGEEISKVTPRLNTGG